MRRRSGPITLATSFGERTERVIAAASPVGDQPLLSLSFLDPAGYPNGEAVARDDRIADPSHDYVAQAQALHA